MSRPVAGITSTLSELARDGRGWILLLVAGGWFLSLGVRLTVPALLPYLREAFSLGLTGAGLLVSVLWIAYALGQLPGGILSDRLGEGRVLFASTAICGVLVALVALAWSPIVLFGAVALFGFATAFYGPVRFTILSDIYERRDGTAIGITLSAGEVGNAVLPATAGIVAAAATWRLGFGLTVPLFALVALGILIHVPSRTSGETSAVDDLSVETLRYVLRAIGQRAILLVTAVQLLVFFAWQGFTGFYPTYLVEMKGLAPSTAALLYGFFFAAGILVQPLAGAGVDRFGAKRTLPVILVVGVVGLGALPVIDSLAGLVAVTLLLSGMIGVTPITQTFLANALPTDMKGTGLGLLRTGFMLLGATSPTIVGVLADAGYFDEAFVLLAAVVALGAVFVVMLPREKV